MLVMLPCLVIVQRTCFNFLNILRTELMISDHKIIFMLLEYDVSFQPSEANILLSKAYEAGAQALQTICELPLRLPCNVRRSDPKAVTQVDFLNIHRP